jgi:hypothetical protein
MRTTKEQVERSVRFLNIITESPLEEFVDDVLQDGHYKRQGAYNLHKLERIEGKGAVTIIPLCSLGQFADRLRFYIDGIGSEKKRIGAASLPSLEYAFDEASAENKNQSLIDSLSEVIQFLKK